MELDELFKVIGPNVRRYREKTGLTQNQLAEHIGVTPSFISKVECGKKAVKLKTLYEIAAVLHVGMDALVYEAHDSAAMRNIQRMLDGKSAAFISGIEDIVRVCLDRFGKEDDEK